MIAPLPTKTRANVPMNSATKCRHASRMSCPLTSVGPRRARSLDHSTQYQRGIDSTEAKRVGEDVLDTLLPPRTRQKIKIAGLVRNLKIDCGRKPLLLQCERADGCLDRAGRAKSMTVVALGPAHRDFVRVISHHFL